FSDLREKSQNFVIYLLFGILIFVFIFFFGPQSDGCTPPRGAVHRAGWAASVGGEEITQQEVEVMVRRVLNTRDRDEASLDALRRDSLLMLIDQYAVAQRAAAFGLAVSEKDVTRHIVKKDANDDFPAYGKRDGSFDYDRWVDWVHQALGTTPDDYRKLIARELLIKKYLEFLGHQAQVADAEVRAAFDRSERTWNLEYLSFDPSDVATPANAPVMSAAEAAAWVEVAENKARIQKYYDDNKAQYDRDKEVKVRRITVKLAKEADAAKAEANKAEVRKKVDELLAAARAPGADFAALAREKSEDSFKDEGGDMGWQSRENTSPENYDVFTKLEVGQVSDVQEAPFGFWFARVDEIRQPVKKTLDDVKSDIALILAADAKRATQARAQAETALAAAKTGKSLAEILHGPTPPPAPASEGADGAPAAPTAPETGDLNEDRLSFDPIVGKSKAIAALLPALTMEKPLVEQVFEVEGKFVIVKLKARKDPSDADFAERKNDYIQRLRQDRQEALLGPWQATLIGTPRYRAQARQMTASSGLTVSLPEPGKDPSVQINLEAFPPPAEPSAPASKAAGG
ncbi:MAG: SurA N-terminal domain-containing protein, partial [Deltaproteobacteria bacterium]|nr:SurA N-terminal domain-containing protein [Deltaproteobacteria bacterium]